MPDCGKLGLHSLQVAQEHVVGVRCMKMKLNLPFRVGFKVKLPSCDGSAEGM